MICKIHGMLCGISEQINIKTGEVTPIAHLFSGDEAIKISGFVADPKQLGQQIDISCEVKLREFDGKKYITYKALQSEKGV